MQLNRAMDETIDNIRISASLVRKSAFDYCVSVCAQAGVASSVRAIASREGTGRCEGEQYLRAAHHVAGEPRETGRPDLARRNSAEGHSAVMFAGSARPSPRF